VSPASDDLRCRLDVWFGPVEGVAVPVPLRLWEWYWVGRVPEADRYVEGVATYDDFRRYTTEVGTPVVR
jgi:hypothetical protein